MKFSTSLVREFKNVSLIIFSGDVVRTIVKSFGLSFLISSMLKLIHDVLVFVSPVLLKRIIGYAATDEELWKGNNYSEL